MLRFINLILFLILFCEVNAQWLNFNEALLSITDRGAFYTVLPVRTPHQTSFFVVRVDNLYQYMSRCEGKLLPPMIFKERIIEQLHHQNYLWVADTNLGSYGFRLLETHDTVKKYHST